MTPVEWFILLMSAGFVLVVVEVFLPGWVAGTAAGICMVAASVTAFPAFGFKGGMLACILLMGGSLGFVALWFRILPKTGAGRTFILSEEMTPQRDVPEYGKLLHEKGHALTRLAPGGLASFSGKRVDVLSDGDWVDGGDPVEVVKVVGRAVTVRRIRG